MKIRKALSVLCAITMLTSTLPAASAAEAEPLSKYAGQTMPVQVVEETEDGLTSRIVEVIIPEGATKAEEDFLVRSTALGKGDVATFSTNDTYYPIGQASGRLELTSTATKVGGGFPQGVSYDDISQIFVDFTVESLSLSQTTIFFQIQAAGNPADDNSNWKGIKPYNVQPPWRVIFATYEYPTDPSEKGIAVYGKTTPGTDAVLSSCSVFGVVK